MSFVSPKVAAKHYNVSTTTLQNWANNGQIEIKILESGHRRYRLASKSEEKKCYIYCRVSSVKQSPDLLRQVKNMRAKYPTHIVVTDIGSGLNYNRKGFKRILESLVQGNIKEVVVTYKDRWCRFGYELFEWLFEKYDANIIAVHSAEIKSKQQELTEDLMAILGVFNAKYNGSRKYDNQKGGDQTTEIHEIEIATDV